MKTHIKKYATFFDSGTFGNSQAATRLAEILSQRENKIHMTFVSKHIHDYFRISNEVNSDLVGSPYRKFVLELIFAHKKKIFSDKSALPSKIRTYAMNVMSTHFKKTNDQAQISSEAR